MRRERWIGARAGRALVVMALASLLVSAGAGKAAAATRGTVRSVANPPAITSAKLTVRVHAGVSAVAVYLSPQRRLVKGDVLLARRAAIRHGAVRLRLPASLRPTPYFVIACPRAGTKRGCAASRRPTVKPPRRLSAPVQAHPAPALSRASSATIGAAGGTLSATAADGTRFRLDVPAGSVADGTTITMTPLSSLGGPRWAARLVGAVQLAPEGLLLMRGATLTVIPTHSVPVARQAAVGYTASGADLHEVPHATKSGAIAIPLAHFSGAGVVNSAGGPPPSQSGSTILDFYSQLVAEVEAQARAGRLNEADAARQANEWLEDALADVMREEVPPGRSDDAAAEHAMRDLLTIARMAALTSGQDDAFFERVRPTVLDLLDGEWNRAQARCVADHDLSQVQRILEFDHRRALLGAQERIAEDFSCLHFTVKLDSQVHFDPSQAGYGEQFSGGYDWHYQADVPLAYEAATPGFPIDGGAPGSFASASGTVSNTVTDCDGLGGTATETQTLTSAAGNTVTVSNLTYQLTGQDVSDVLLTMTSTAAESYHVSETGACTTSYDTDGTLWWSAVSSAAVTGGYATSPDGSTLTIPLSPSSGEGDIAQGTIPVNDGVGHTGYMTLEVQHTPPAPPQF